MDFGGRRWTMQKTKTYYICSLPFSGFLVFAGVSIKYGVAVSGLDELFVSCLVAGGMDNVWSVGKYTTTI